jgi:hypothetical protein
LSCSITMPVSMGEMKPALDSVKKGVVNAF